MSKPTHYDQANAVCEAASSAIEVAEDVKHGRRIVDQDQHARIMRRAECLEAAHETLRALDQMQQASEQMRIKSNREAPPFIHVGDAAVRAIESIGKAR